MSAEALVAAVHVSQASRPFAGTHGSAAGFFWFVVGNVVMLVAFLGMAAVGREPPAASHGVPQDATGGGAEGAEGAARSRGGAGQAPPLLASDPEREATATAVSHAIAEGRLTVEEGAERIEAAYRARDRAQLAALVADLPQDDPESRPGVRRGRRRH